MLNRPVLNRPVLNRPVLDLTRLPLYFNAKTTASGMRALTCFAKPFAWSFVGPLPDAAAGPMATTHERRNKARFSRGLLGRDVPIGTCFAETCFKVQR